MRMLRFSFVVALVVLCLSFEARAQLSDLELNPNPASTLEPVEALLGFSWFAGSQTFDIETDVTGSVVTIEISVSGQPSGLPAICFIHRGDWTAGTGTVRRCGQLQSR